MKLLRVSGNNKYGNFALVDDNDFIDLSQRLWHWTVSGYVSTGGYWTSKDGSKSVPYLLHRVITNAPDELVVDHRNSNRNDNRQSNLKVCTQSENSKNKFGSAQYDYKIPIKDLVVIKAWYEIAMSEEVKKMIGNKRNLFYRCHKDETEQNIEQFKLLGFTDFAIKQGVYFKD